MRTETDVSHSAEVAELADGRTSVTLWTTVRTTQRTTSDGGTVTTIRTYPVASWTHPTDDQEQPALPLGAADEVGTP